MGIKIFRMSGLPVSLEHLDAYRAEWGSGFDTIKAECGNDMLAMQDKLQELETALLQKYAKIGEVQLPKSKKQWKALMQQFMSPVMVAQSSENTAEYVLVIVDVPLG